MYKLFWFLTLSLFFKIVYTQDKYVETCYFQRSFNNEIPVGFSVDGETWSIGGTSYNGTSMLKCEFSENSSEMTMNINDTIFFENEYQMFFIDFLCKGSGQGMIKLQLKNLNDGDWYDLYTILPQSLTETTYEFIHFPSFAQNLDPHFFRIISSEGFGSLYIENLKIYSREEFYESCSIDSNDDGIIDLIDLLDFLMLFNQEINCN